MSPRQDFDGPDQKYRERLAKSISTIGSDPLSEAELKALEQGYEAKAKTLSAMAKPTHRQAVVRYTTRSSDIDVFLDSLPLPDGPADPPSEPQLTGSSSSYSGDDACMTNSYHAGVSALDLAALAPHSDVLWPGSIVSGDSLYSGLLTPITLARGRGEVTLSNQALSATAPGPFTVSIEQPSLQNVSSAISQLLRANIGPNGVQAFTGGITIETYRSLDEAAMHLDASAKWLSGNVRNILDITSSSKRTNVVVRMIQGYYDLVFSPPGSPDAMFNQGWWITTLLGSASLRAGSFSFR